MLLFSALSFIQCAVLRSLCLSMCNICYESLLNQALFLILCMGVYVCLFVFCIWYQAKVLANENDQILLK